MASKERSGDQRLKRIAGRASDIVYWFMRILILLNIVFMFFPSMNPARLSEKINKNLSLFTSGLSYNSLISNFGRAFRQNWISEDSIKFVFFSAMLMIIGVVVISVGGCMSLGNRNLKRVGLVATLSGAIVEGIGLVGIYQGYLLITASEGADRIQPLFPSAFYLFAAVIIVIALLSLCNLILVPKGIKGEKFYVHPKYQLFLMMLPIIALAFVFSYLPLYGWRYAFFNYNSGETLSLKNFVGLKWFTSLVQNEATRSDIVQVMKNTLAMSGLGILTSWIPMAFAIFLSEIKNSRFRRMVQALTTIPNFISWVLVYAIALAIFSTDGFINTFLSSIGINSSTNYLMDHNHMWLKMMAWGIWKGVGWSAIIYIASISSIDQGLYEAAKVDGAGRFARMWHITVPELMPTFFVLLLLSIGNLLSNGLDQYLVFSNSMNKETIQVLDLYVYNLGIGSGQIPLSTVVGMVKSVISLLLLFSANGLSKLIRGKSIV